MKVAIIGAGLAGLSCGYTLQQNNISCTIYEAADEIASGGSGNPLGMVNPRISALRTPQSDFYTAAFQTAISLFEKLDNIDYNPCGALHLVTDEKKEKRFSQTVENWRWPEDIMCIVDKNQASDIAGIPVDYPALYLAQSCSISPYKLCETYAQNLNIKLGHTIENLSTLNEDYIILAPGPATKNFAQSDHLPIKAVRGQVTQAQETEFSAQQKCALHYGGYCSPSVNGMHTIGATFQRWLDHTEVLEEDNEYNIKRLEEFVPSLKNQLNPIEARASLRTTSPDHIPIIGHLQDNIYVTTAHGSHGIISSLLAAHIITDLILEHTLCVSTDTLAELSPSRFEKGKD